MFAHIRIDIYIQGKNRMYRNYFGEATLAK